MRGPSRRIVPGPREDASQVALPQAKSAKPEQFVDLSFLQELEKEGFFAEMAKKYPSKG